MCKIVRMMTLTQFLAREGLTQAEFGARIRCSGATVSRICAGIGSVNRVTLARIFWETGGRVTPNDIFGLPPRLAETPKLDAA